MDIEIDDKKLRYLNDPALAELKKATAAFVEDVVSEAERLETGSHATPGDPEITSSHVHGAADLLRKGYAKPRRSQWSVIREVASYAAALALGFITPLIGIEGWAIPAFILLVFIGLGCYFWNLIENAR